MIEAVERTNQLDDTYLIFNSDNGFHLSLHRRCCSTARLPPNQRSLGFAPPPSIFMTALLPGGDESAMNFKGLGGVFRSIFANWELTSQRTWLARQARPKKLHRAGPMGMAHRVAILFA